MKLLVTRPLPQQVLDAIDPIFTVDVRQDVSPLPFTDMVDALVQYDAVLPTLRDQFSQDVFEQVRDVRCKILANFGVGYNHIDTAAAANAGVVVTNTPGAVTDATADTAMTLMLMSCRRAGEGERLVRSGKWDGWHPTQMLGLHLTGKTVGIVGMGRIGQAIAQRCRLGFGMKVVFHNRSVKTVEGCIQLENLNAVMDASDIVVVATPGGPDTHHLVDADVLAQMQTHAHLINISRGDVIDEQALIAALKSGQIAGAGLDVYEQEPLVPEGLIALENVVLLPHLGTAALEVRVEMGLMAVANVNAFAARMPPPNAV